MVSSFCLSPWRHPFLYNIFKSLTAINLEHGMPLPHWPIIMPNDFDVVTLIFKVTGVTKVKLCFCMISQKLLQLSVWNMVYSYSDPLGCLLIMTLILKFTDVSKAVLVIIHTGTGRMHPGCKRPGKSYPTLVNSTQASTLAWVQETLNWCKQPLAHKATIEITVASSLFDLGTWKSSSSVWKKSEGWFMHKSLWNETTATSWIRPPLWLSHDQGVFYWCQVHLTWSFTSEVYSTHIRVDNDQFSITKAKFGFLMVSPKVSELLIWNLV